MQNHGYLEMISPLWPQNRPSCQGASRKIWHRLQGNPFLDIVIVPSLKADIEVTPLTSINPLGIQNPYKFRSNYQEPRSKNGLFRSPHQKGRQPDSQSA